MEKIIGELTNKNANLEAQIYSLKERAAQDLLSIKGYYEHQAYLSFKEEPIQ